MKIMEIPECERPREKLICQGVESLTDSELIAILVGTGNARQSALQIGHSLINHFKSISQLIAAPVEEFKSVSGAGIATFSKIQSGVELTRRSLTLSPTTKQSISSANCAESYLSLKLRHRKVEVFALLHLDSQHQILNFQELSTGTINMAAVYPREVVRAIIEQHSAAVILAHNHPSGQVEPSQTDKQLTEQLISALKLIDVNVLDHVIVGDNQCFSFAKFGLI